MNGGLGKYNTNQAKHDKSRKLNETPTMNDRLGKYNTNPAKHDGLSKLIENPAITGGMNKLSPNSAMKDSSYLIQTESRPRDDRDSPQF